jgi:List-Bact-rpt repeat protein
MWCCRSARQREQTRHGNAEDLRLQVAARRAHGGWCRSAVVASLRFPVEEGDVRCDASPGKVQQVERRACRIVIVVLLLLTITAWRGEAIGGQLTLNWINPATSELGLSIERSVGTTGTFGEIVTTGPNVTAYTDSNVANGTSYCYRVRAFDASGYSDYSNVACGTTPQTFGLAVVKFGAGSGTVTSTPAGIICGANCSASYPPGTAVTLTADPASGSTFTGWSGGGCSGTAVCSVTLTTTTTVTATFTALGTDTTLPAVTITTPTSATTYTTSTSPLALGGTAAHTVGVAQVSWASNRGGSGIADGTTNWSASGIALQPGNNVLTVTSRDAAGNTVTATLTVTMTPYSRDDIGDNQHSDDAALP